MSKQELLNYITDFGVENNLIDEHVPEQIRAFFTTWCFINRIDADTKECDEALQKIYWRASLEESIKYEEFKNFMLEFIV